MPRLVSTFEDFLRADYNLLYISGVPSDFLFKLFAHPIVPVVSVVLYLSFSKWVLNFIRATFKIQPKGPFMQSLTIVHSSLLAIYSLWTFVYGVGIAVPYVFEHGFMSSLCDVSGELWYAKGFGFWVTHFYLSKYYEFIDTWIVLLKGREPMFLQTFHHAGVVILMWGVIATENTGAGMILLCFNSFIHTLMYTYYVLAAFGYNSPLKNYLTMAQIVQFLIGIVIITPAYYCINSAQAFVIFLLQLYVTCLVVLFYRFYQASYLAKKTVKRGDKNVDNGVADSVRTGSEIKKKE